MSKSNGFWNWSIVYVLFSILCESFGKILSLNNTRDCAITSFSSFNNNFNFVLFFINSNVGNIEWECSWEIFIKNSHSSLGIISLKSFFSVDIVKFNKEIKIWFPFVVVFDFNFNCCFNLIFRNSDLLVNWNIIFLWVSRVSNTSNTESLYWVLHLLSNFNSYSTSTFCHRVMQTFKC